jgi:predicted transcriptional regulator
MLLEDKDTYSIQELFDLLPIPIAELARQSGINEVTLARIRDGRATRLSTRNKLLMALSRVYEKQFTPRNVTGIHVHGQEERESAVA